MASGLTSAITNPLESEIKTAIKAADVMMGHDENCADWIQATRDAAPTAEGETRKRGGRERRFRRRG
jgi:5-methyltetrahydrofolate--homocysteine methyltransferase